MRQQLPRALALAAAVVTALACSHPGARPPPSPRSSPVLVGETLEGERVEIGGPGPVRLVELWATWCEPCGPATERARPVLARHPGVVAYSISIDTDRAAVARYLEGNSVLGTPLVYPGGTAAAARQGLNQVPMFVALDSRGRIAGRVVGLMPNLAPALDRLLGQAEGRAGRTD